MNDNDNPEPITFIELSPKQSTLLRQQFELDREEAGPKLPIDALPIAASHWKAVFPSAPNSRR